MIQQENKNEVMTKKEYILWLEMSLASSLKAIEQLHYDMYMLTRKNTQLEDENIATTMALIRNPLRSTKQFNA